MSSEHVLNKIEQEIKALVDTPTEITSIEFEGSEVAIYTTNPASFDEGDRISRIARKIRKRVVIRSDPSARLEQQKARDYITKHCPKEVSLGNIFFDESLGEVVIYADKPSKLTGKDGSFIKDTLTNSGWRPNIIRIPPLESHIVQAVRNVLFADTKGRRDALRRIGRMVHRPTLLDEPIVRITALGGYLEVGRTSTLLQTGDSNILIDCGVSVGSTTSGSMMPRLDLPEFDISTLDAVIISHAHLDHCGFVPYLFKYGYEGPVYTTPPTRDLMTMLQIDYLDIAEKDGKLLPYSKDDIRKETLHTIAINYGDVTDIAPGIRLTFHNAGHILGSSIVHLHVGDGKYNIAFAHDFKFGNSRLLDRATSRFPRLETLVMESTYGNPRDVNPSRQKSEERIAELISATFARGGKVLIPVLAVGRAQELQLVIEHLMRTESISTSKVYLDGMIREATAVTTNHPEFVSRQLRERIFVADDNPFLADCFVSVTSQEERDTILGSTESCIIMATSGMLVGGPSVHYFTGLAEDERNTLIFVSYQGKGTLGRKINEGATQVIMNNTQGKPYGLDIKLQVTRIKGFTGHSDRKELLEFAKRVNPRPKQYLLVHGESSKCKTLANSIARSVKREALAPPIGDTTRLY